MSKHSAGDGNENQSTGDTFVLLAGASGQCQPKQEPRIQAELDPLFTHTYLAVEDFV